LLVMAAALLTAVHVVGLLFGRPVLRPAEVLATLGLLAYAIRYDLLADRYAAVREDPDADRLRPDRDPAAGRPRTWALSVGAALLVVGAALTVPSAPGTGPGLQILSPEEYTGLLREAWIDTLTPVAVTLLFVLVLLVSRRVPVRRGPVLVGGVVAAVLIVGSAVLRFFMIRRSPDDLLLFGDGDRTSGIPLFLAALPLLLLALASLALVVGTAARRQWPAAAGGVLLVLAALGWLDSTLGSAGLPYEVRAAGSAFSLDQFLATTALPQPTQALTAALRLTAAILLITGLARHRSRQPRISA
jgi:hypothetical protein